MWSKGVVTAYTMPVQKDMLLLHGGQAGTFAQIQLSYRANVTYSVTAYTFRGRNSCTCNGTNVTTLKL